MTVKELRRALQPYQENAIVSIDIDTIADAYEVDIPVILSNLKVKEGHKGKGVWITAYVNPEE